MRKSWDSHETVMRQSWDSQEAVMRQSWDSHETVYYSTPVAGFADMSVLVCSVRWLVSQWVTFQKGGHMTMACLSGKGHALSLLNRVLKIRLDFWTTGLVCWSTHNNCKSRLTPSLTPSHCECSDGLWLQGEAAFLMHSFRDAEPQQVKN